MFLIFFHCSSIRASHCMNALIMNRLPTVEKSYALQTANKLRMIKFFFIFFFFFFDNLKANQMLDQRKKGESNVAAAWDSFSGLRNIKIPRTLAVAKESTYVKLLSISLLQLVAQSTNWLVFQKVCLMVILHEHSLACNNLQVGGCVIRTFVMDPHNLDTNQANIYSLTASLQCTCIGLMVTRQLLQVKI